MGGTEPQVRERAFHLAAKAKLSSLILYAGNFFKEYRKDMRDFLLGSSPGLKSLATSSTSLALDTKDLNWDMDKKPMKC